MIRKFFPLDKNYLLESAQISVQQNLLHNLVDRVKHQFELRHNPLMLDDEFSRKIRNYQPASLKPLDPFYQCLAGIYRYKYGDNQLELLWNGDSHYNKYQDEWSAVFTQWTNEFCTHGQFLQAVLDLTVFLPENRHAQLAENRMNFVMLGFFDLKIHKSRGIVAMKVA